MSKSKDLSVLLLVHPEGITSTVIAAVSDAVELKYISDETVLSRNQRLVEAKSLWLREAACDKVSVLVVTTDTLGIQAPVFPLLIGVPDTYVLGEITICESVKGGEVSGTVVDMSADISTAFATRACNTAVRLLAHASKSISVREGLQLHGIPSETVFEGFLNVSDDSNYQAFVTYSAIGRDLVYDLPGTEDKSMYFPELYVDGNTSNMDAVHDIDDADVWEVQSEMFDVLPEPQPAEDVATIRVFDKSDVDVLESAPGGTQSYGDEDAHERNARDFFAPPEGDDEEPEHLFAAEPAKLELIDATVRLQQTAGLFVVRPGPECKTKRFEHSRIITSGSVINSEFCDHFNKDHEESRQVLIACNSEFDFDSGDTSEAVDRVSSMYLSMLNARAEDYVRDVCGPRAVSEDVAVVKHLSMTDSHNSFESRNAYVNYASAVTVVLPPLGKSKAKMDRILSLVSRRASELSDKGQYIGFVVPNNDMLLMKPAFINVQPMFEDNPIEMVASCGNVIVYSASMLGHVNVSEFETLCKNYAQSYSDTFNPESLTHIFIFKANS